VKKNILLLLILAITTVAGYAQTDSTKRTPTGAITYTRPGFFRSGKFMVDGSQISYKEVTERLSSYQPAAEEYNKYKVNRNLTYYAGGSVILLAVASAITNGNSSTYKTTSSKVLIGLSGTFLIPEFIFALNRNKHFRNAGRIYNQQFN